MDLVTVGEYAKIGAAAVVLGGHSCTTTAVGLPARVVRVHTPEEIERDTTIGGETYDSNLQCLNKTKRSIPNRLKTEK